MSDLGVRLELYGFVVFGLETFIAAAVYDRMVSRSDAASMSMWQQLGVLAILFTAWGVSTLGLALVPLAPSAHLALLSGIATLVVGLWIYRLSLGR